MAESSAITSLDIGARGKIKSDLKDLAPYIDIIGFEPDEEACGELNARYSSPGKWKSVRFIPTALGGRAKEETLFVTRAGGTSSIYPPLPNAGESFSRGDYYIIKEAISLRVYPLDEVLEAHDLPSPDHVKLDVEGYELEVLAGAVEALKHVSAIRAEISFTAMREGQPLYYELGSFLDQAGFTPFEFMELHHWRNSSKIKYPARTRGPIPFSKGQMIHGDLLFYRKPETLDLSSEEKIQRAVRYCMIALCHGHLDHAALLFQKPEICHFISDRGMPPKVLEDELNTISKNLFSSYRKKEIRTLAHNLRGLFFS